MRNMLLGISIAAGVACSPAPEPRGWLVVPGVTTSFPIAIWSEGPFLNHTHTTVKAAFSILLPPGFRNNGRAGSWNLGTGFASYGWDQLHRGDWFHDLALYVRDEDGTHPPSPEVPASLCASVMARHVQAERSFMSPGGRMVAVCRLASVPTDDGRASSWRLYVTQRSVAGQQVLVVGTAEASPPHEREISHIFDSLHSFACVTVNTIETLHTTCE